MEGGITKRIQLALSKMGAKLFRNNTGLGWVGDITKISGGIVIRNHRPLKAGLHKGSSDLIGWMPVIITEKMIGEKVAIFTAIEVKGPRTRTTNAQKVFIGQILKDGGFAMVAKSEEEAMNYIKNQKP